MKDIEVIKFPRGFKKRNLKKMIKVMEGVENNNFTMSIFSHTNECGTIGCILGHCKPALDTAGEFFERDFSEWGDWYLGLPPETESMDDTIWVYLFSSSWDVVDNTVEGAIARMKHCLDLGGVPADAKAQLYFGAELTYKIN